MVVMAAPVDTGRWPDHVADEWTVDDLETLPDNGLRYELLDGTLLVTPSPTPCHQGAILEFAVPTTPGLSGCRRTAGSGG